SVDMNIPPSARVTPALGSGRCPGIHSPPPTTAFASVGSLVVTRAQPPAAAGTLSFNLAGRASFPVRLSVVRADGDGQRVVAAKEPAPVESQMIPGLHMYTPAPRDQTQWDPLVPSNAAPGLGVFDQSTCGAE